MNTAAAVLYSVAKELAQKAKASLPELCEGEKIMHEWYDDGIYYRETVLNGNTYLHNYDFRQKVAGFAAAG